MLLERLHWVRGKFMSKKFTGALFATTALTLALPGVASAQGGTSAPTSAATRDQASSALEEIVVTAQKREQNVQDVPIAVTALTTAALVNNRVENVTDLSGLAPGVSVVPAAGGSQIPSFSMRGVTSYGVVPGSDKEVSIYLDGVYISSPRGSIFNLPDARSIEVLRGPQGTLFGRNATAGAVSVTTRDPNGKMGVDAEFTVGNYDQYRMRLSVSTPQIGPFSAYGTYVHDQRRGDIKNLGAGTVWDRTSSGLGVGVSPAYLGGKNADSYFAALRFEPTDNFKMVYKFDHDNETDTPAATALVAVNSAAPLTGPLIQALTAGVPLASNGLRPDAVDNSFSVPSKERITGHNLTATWEASDNITIKNVAAYRKTYQFAAVPIDGFSGVPFNAAAVVPYATLSAFSRFPPNAANGFSTAGALAAIPGFAGFFGTQVGQTFLGVATQPQSTSQQWSDELQGNYRSKLLTLTAGVLWFHGKDSVGGPAGITNTFQFAIVPSSGLLPLGQYGLALNDAKSYAGYAQAELHVSHKLDLVLGGRVTRDDKSGTFNAGFGLAPPTTVIPFKYTKTQPTWLVGVNYKPTDDILLYAKGSDAFVSGGSVAAIPFAPEKATSFEAGLKAEWFDRRLRTNLAVYTVRYDNLQTAQGATNFGPYLTSLGNSLNPPVSNLASIVSTFIVPIGGPVHAKGVEFEATGQLARGVTIGGNLSYHHTSYSTVDPRILASVAVNGQNEYLPGTLSPAWEGGVYGEVHSKRFSNGASLMARIDGNWHGKYLLQANPDIIAPIFRPYNYAPAAWIVNGRVALQDITIGGVTGEVAVWGRNLTQNRDITYALSLAGALAANYQQARTLGVDVRIHY
jgi:iron complex outermembrane receptor protein